MEVEEKKLDNGMYELSLIFDDTDEDETLLNDITKVAEDKNMKVSVLLREMIEGRVKNELGI